MNCSRKIKFILVFVSSHLFFFAIVKVKEINRIGTVGEPIMQNFILPFMFSFVLGSIISLIMTVSVKRLKSLRTIFIVIIIGILLCLFAFLSPLITEVGGAFDGSNGRNGIPNGLPFSFLKPDLSIRSPYQPDYPDLPLAGWSPPFKFCPTPFVADIVFWIAFAMIIVFFKKMYCKRRK